MAERPEDLNLPQSVIGRIMKDAVPDGISVSKEARNAVSKAASVFVLYATSCANNHALQSKRKTLNANDVLTALQDMEFEEFIDPLQKSLEEYRKDQKEKKEASEKRKKSKEAGEDGDNKTETIEEEDGKEESVGEEEELEVDEFEEEEDADGWIAEGEGKSDEEVKETDDDDDDDDADDDVENQDEVTEIID